jgi:AsmA protein
LISPIGEEKSGDTTMRALKIVGFGLLGLLGLVVIAAGALWIFFDPNDYKADIERLVEERTHRRLTLQGDLKLSVFPWLAVQMGPAQLHERAGFGDQPFVSVENVRLSLRLWPLLKGQVEVGNVQLDAPSIRLITDEQGRHNWSDLAAGDETAPPSEAASDTNTVVGAQLAGIDIHRGSIVMEDRKAKSRTAIRDFELSTGAIASGKPFDVQLSLGLEQNQQPVMPVTFAANVTADFDQAIHRADNMTFTVQWHGEDMPQGGVPIALRADNVVLNLKQQLLDVQGLALEAGQAKLSGAMAGKEIFDAPQFQGQLTLAPLALREALRDFGFKPPVTRDSQVLKQLDFSTEFAATTTSLALNKMTLKLDDTTAKGEFGIADFAAKALRFDLNVDRIDFDRYLPPVAESSGAADVEKQAADGGPTAIPVEALRTLNARGDLRVGDATFGGMRLSNLHVGVNARDGDVRLQPTNADVYSGQYRGGMTLNVVSTPRMSVESHVNGIDFAPLFKDVFDSQRITGRGDANIKVTAVGTDTDAMMKTLNGTLDFQARDGAFEGVDLWYEIRRARALLRREAIPARIDAERTPFTACRGSGTLTNGVLRNNDLDVSSQYLKVNGGGTVDLVKDQIDYKLMANVLRMPKEGAAANPDLVEAKIPVTVTGALTDPKIRPDVEGLIKNEVKQRVDEEKDKLQEKLQDKLQDRLRGILGWS